MAKKKDKWDGLTKTQKIRFDKIMTAYDFVRNTSNRITKISNEIVADYSKFALTKLPQWWTEKHLREFRSCEKILNSSANEYGRLARILVPEKQSFVILMDNFLLKRRRKFSGIEKEFDEIEIALKSFKKKLSALKNFLKRITVEFMELKSLTKPMLN